MKKRDKMQMLSADDLRHALSAHDASIELLPSERGKHWTVTKEFTVTDAKGRRLTIPAGFVHDRYTFAPDLSDTRPSIAHDFAYVRQTWDDGSKIKRRAADALLRHLLSKSARGDARRWRFVYWVGVRVGGLSGWISHRV